MSAITTDLPALAQSIKDWGRELGFQQVGISGLDLAEHEQHLERWLAAGYHGEMDYMGAHGSKRSHPEELFDFGEDAAMGRGIPIMLSTTDRMCYNSEGTEVLLAWRLKQ